MIYAFERDSYLDRLETEIVEVGFEEGRAFAVAADTVFYPEGGGQPADRGTLGGIRVMDVQKREGRIRHYLERAAEEGPAAMELDWARRFDHMQQHTAQHLLTALAHKEFGWETTSFHLAADQSDIELDTPQASLQQLRWLEDLLAAEIRAARRVGARRVTQQKYSRLRVRSRGLPQDHQGDVRIVEIEGIDRTTCGGTHLASTCELESVALLATAPMRGGTRLYFLAGSRVRRLLASREQLLSRLRELLATSDEQLLETLELRSAQLREARRREKFLQQQLARLTARLLASSQGPLAWEHFRAQEMGFLQAVARAVVGEAPAKTVFLSAESTQGTVFVLAAGSEAGFDVAAWGPRVAELLGGRGGGSGGFFQGKAPGSKGRDKVLDCLRDAVGS